MPSADTTAIVPVLRRCTLFPNPADDSSFTARCSLLVRAFAYRIKVYTTTVD
ncbi:hypothetical protein GCM10023257_67280 [Streptomyces hyderabadensis]|uniref:Uncharacterized protein n=1 Tax=Streptomyces hyderabadensis TaxID=598549 RepID=A0ABP9IX97_9ACTN